MFIIVRHADRIIIGSAVRQPSEAEASKNGYQIFEIDDAEFSVHMIGSKLESFDEVE